MRERGRTNKGPLVGRCKGNGSQNCTDPVTVSMVGEGVVFQGMRGYTVPPHAPAVACFTMSVTQHIWLKKKYYRVPIFNPVVSEATRLSGYQP